MRLEYGRRWWLPVLALITACLVLPPALAKPAEQRKIVVGEVSGTPMGTWVTLSEKRGKTAASYQVDLAHAKITEKGKALKRHQLEDKMRLRVRGRILGTKLAADTVEVLARAPKKG